MSENVRKVSKNISRTCPKMPEKCPKTCPEHVRKCPKTLEKHDKISLPAVPGIEPGTLRIRLRGWIRVQPHWANSVTTIPVSRAFLCIRIRDPCAPGAVGLFKIPKSDFLRKNCAQQGICLVKNSPFLVKNVRWSQNRFFPKSDFN